MKPMTTRELIEAKAKELMVAGLGAIPKEEAVYTISHGISISTWCISKYVLASEIRARIGDLEYYLLGENHHNKENTDCNIWADYVYTKNKISELQKQLKEIEDV